MMHLTQRLLFLSFLSLFSPFTWASSDTLTKSDSLKAKSGIAPAKTAVVISITKEIDPGLTHFVKRAIQDAQDSARPDFIIFEINTFGGRLDAAFDIVDAITEIKNCSTIAYVNQKAISAGALISMACNRIVMGKGTEIGDCAPIIQGEQGIIMAGEKIESPLRARFRTLANRNGYPVLLAEAMVSIDLHILSVTKDGKKEYMTKQRWDELGKEGQEAYDSMRTVVPKGQLLTLTDTEAEKYGFSQGSFESLDDFMEKRPLKKVGTITTNWSEEMVRAIGKVAPLLMLLGFGALYMEIKSPGFGVFGILGILCLAIVFGSKYAAGLANYTEMLLLIAGASLVILEIFVFPGTFLFGGAGVILMGISLILSFQTFNIPDPEFPWQQKIFINNVLYVLSFGLIALLVPLIAFKYLIPLLPRRISLVAEGTLKDAHVNLVTEGFPDLKVGAQGKTRTALRPVGKVFIGNKQWEAQAINSFIESGVPIEVCEVVGNKITVREIKS